MKNAFNILKKIIRYFWNNSGLAATIYCIVNLFLMHYDIIEHNVVGYLLYGVFLLFFAIQWRFDVLDDKMKRLFELEAVSIKLHQEIIGEHIVNLHSIIE